MRARPLRPFSAAPPLVESSNFVRHEDDDDDDDDGNNNIVHTRKIAARELNLNKSLYSIENASAILAARGGLDELSAFLSMKRRRASLLKERAAAKVRKGFILLL